MSPFFYNFFNCLSVELKEVGLSSSKRAGSDQHRSQFEDGESQCLK